MATIRHISQSTSASDGPVQSFVFPQKQIRPTDYVTRQDGVKGSGSIAPHSANLGGERLALHSARFTPRATTIRTTNRRLVGPQKF